MSAMEGMHNEEPAEAEALPVPTAAPNGVTLKDQIAEVGREVGLRRSVYKRWIAAGRLKQEDADRQLARMEAALWTLKQVEAKG